MQLTPQLTANACSRYEGGDLVKAEHLCRQALDQNPSDPAALHLLGLIALRLSKQEEALANLTRAVELDPEKACFHSDLGQALAGLGRWEEAIAAHETARRLDPHCALVYYNLGATLAAQGKLSEAAAACCRVLSLKPDYAEAHNDLGLVLVRQGNLEAAKACYQAAIYFRPDYAEAHDNLGLILFSLGNVDEAVLAYREAVRLKPGFAKAHNDLAIALADRGELVEAVVHYEVALRLEPEAAYAHANLAGLLIEQGLLDQAIAHCQEALRLNARSPTPYFHLGALAAQERYYFTGAQIDQMESLLATGGLSVEDTGSLHFTLAALRDKEKCYEEAFDHYRRGNELKREAFRQRKLAFDPDTQRRFIDLLIATFDRPFLERTGSFGLDTELPIFIVGMPRSGTTLAMQILASHPQVAAGGELRDLEQVLYAPPEGEGAGSYPAYMSSVSAATVRALGERYLERLRTIAKGAQRVGDKMPHNYLHLGAIAALFTRARIIHCRREPLDTCLSCYFQNFNWVNYASSLEDLGFYYRHYERLMAHWRAVLPLPTYELQYEDLIAHPEATIRELVAFCGLGWNDRCLAFYENPRTVRTASKLQVRRPIYASSIGRWKHYEAYLGPLREALAGRGGANAERGTWMETGQPTVHIGGRTHVSFDRPAPLGSLHGHVITQKAAGPLVASITVAAGEAAQPSIRAHQAEDLLFAAQADGVLQAESIHRPTPAELDRLASDLLRGRS